MLNPTHLSSYDLEREIAKRDETQEDLVRLKKRLWKIKEIYYKLSLDSEFQKLLLESKILFQQKLEEYERHYQEKHSEANVPIQQRLEAFEEHCNEKRETTNDSAEYFNFLIQEEMRTIFGKKLDFTTWLITSSGNAVNREESDKILQIARKMIENNKNEDLDLSWTEIIEFFFEHSRFKIFVGKEKQIIENLEILHREKIDLINGQQNSDFRIEQKENEKTAQIQVLPPSSDN
jgi:hypothetical protein